MLLQLSRVVLDIGLPGLNGIEVVRRIRRVSPKSRVVFLTENQSSDVAEAAFEEGACAYVLKSALARELIPSIEAALEGTPFITPKLTSLSTLPKAV